MKSPESGAEYAFRLLSARDYSREGMRQKLRAKGLEAEEAEEIVRKLTARGFIDDQRFARHTAAYYVREKLWGPRRVVQKLLHKGIELDLAREATGQAEEDGASRERLRKVLNSKLKGQSQSGMLPQEKKRLADYLRQRGFLWEDILEALEEAGGFTEE